MSLKIIVSILVKNFGHLRIQACWNVMDMINAQKGIASIIHRELSLVDPECILVGGAPRDWHFNREASDLDFFFIPSQSISIEDVMSGISLINKLSTPDHHLCSLIPEPLKIWEGVFEGMKIQLVEMSSEAVMRVAVDELHLSISKIYWTPNKGIQMHSQFIETLKSKVIYGKEGYDLKSTYAQKILHKYEGLGFSLGEC